MISAEMTSSEEGQRAEAEHMEEPASELSEPQAILEQDFSKLEEALEREVWEADGDSLSLYVCEETDDFPPGAMIITEGGADSQAELVHWFPGSQAPRITQVTASLICEALDADSGGAFAIRLAFDEDLEETALLAVTLRRPRESAGEVVGNSEVPADPPPPGSLPVGLHVNGKIAVEDVGKLPILVELTASLNWDKDARRVEVRHRSRPALQSSVGATDEVLTSADFYTQNSRYEGAKALSFHCIGTVKVRLLHLRCVGGPPLTQGQ